MKQGSIAAIVMAARSTANRLYPTGGASYRGTRATPSSGAIHLVREKIDARVNPRIKAVDAHHAGWLWPQD
jgi:hypothetical protein